jgi:hypothetical protein
MPREPAKSFFILFLAASSAVLLALAWINFKVDPFSLYSGPDRDPLLISRVDQFPHMRMTKPRTLRRYQPGAVIVGSSSMGTVPPVHQSWSGYHGYNAAIPGMTSYEMLRFVEHAVAQGTLDRLMIGLDFYIYMGKKAQPRAGFRDARMMRTTGDAGNLAYRVQQMIDWRDTLFTASILGKSLHALSGSADIVRIYYPDGSWRSNSLRLTGQGGYQYMAGQYMAHPKSLASRLEENLANLAQMLDLAYREKLDARIVLTPLHVYIYRLWMSQGRAGDWEAFHRGVLRINRDAAGRHGADPYPVLGFNSLAGIVDEPIEKRSKSARSWFLDGVHFRAPLGEVIMESTWNLDTGIGVVLDESNLDGYLQQVDQLSTTFDRNNTEIIQHIRSKTGLP